jgi:UDP:flavonoid glycosyltransferase YjiC (YdhE family)
VTLAGHTTIMEIISLGIPNNIIPIDNHPEQLKNAVNIKKYGISIVKELKNLDSDEISSDINKLLNDSEIIKRAQTVREIFSDYHGTDDAVKIIMENARDFKSYNNKKISS